MTSAQIRQQFIDFFVKRHGHTFVPSSPVVPLDDPTLLFTNAGMNQFKPIFLGQEKRDYTRAANTQKCIRAGGKHNDLDDVGRSRRHHTFFEMLGNWSFGDYFKRGAIEMAWELLTQIWKLDPTRLHVSCYEGNPAAGIPRDDEAANLWKEIAHLPDDHIHYFGKDNFWEMGDTGPCGPCTEIYIDRRPAEEISRERKEGKVAPVNREDPRVMEIWNLVFIQYNRDAHGKLTPLPSKHVDTGMGLERICQVIQGKDDNYGTDLWTPLFDAISEISNLKYTGQFPKTNAADPQAEAANPRLRHDIAFRVIADHVRCLTFALTDGAVPSNEGRGYVLRRILRRAARFGRQQLGLTEPFLHRLVPVIVDGMGAAFPELKRDPRRVVELIKDEEVSFAQTLDRGIQIFNEAINVAGRQFETAQTLNYGSSATSNSSYSQADRRHSKKYPASQYPRPIISDDVAFKLHDTYGFPIDLTRIMAEERGYAVDIVGYEKLMEQAKDLARSGGKGAESSLSTLSPDALNELAELGAKATDDSAKFTSAEMWAKVVAIWDGRSIVNATSGAESDFAIILDRTNFYAEMGGQVGDQGDLLRGSEIIFAVKTTKRVGDYVLHIGQCLTGVITTGTTLLAAVKSEFRDPTEKNHTATHLLNWSLRQILGDGVQQKGSLVDAEKLRFDFSHNQALTIPELNTVELLARTAIAIKPLTVYTKEVPQEQALKINGLRAVFGEKYPPTVRVVSIGVPVEELLADPANPQWRQYSIEFCGGTHLKSTSEARDVVIIAEESVSRGVRRIVALTSSAAAEATFVAQEMDRLLASAKNSPDEKLSEQIAEINRRLSAEVMPLSARRKVQAELIPLAARQKAFEKSTKSSSGSAIDASAEATKLLASAIDLSAGKLIVAQFPGASADGLRGVVDSLRKKSPSHAIMLACVENDAITFVAAVSDDLIAKGLKAGDWVKQTASKASGGGGGRPQMAQGSGKDVAKMEDALKTARQIAQGLLK